MYPRNVTINDVELNWARIAKPVTNTYGVSQFELQIVAKDKAHADSITAETGLSFKEKDGKFTLNLKRKAMKKDGTENTPVRVVKADATPMTSEEAMKIGNGSRGNVIVWQYEYTFGGSKGIGNSLTAVQVVDMVEYVSASAGADFAPVAATKPADAPF